MSELKRRRVLRLAGFYVVGAWAVVEALDIMFEAWSIPGAALRFVIIAAFVGFPLALVFAWRYDITSKGIARTLPGGETDTTSGLGGADYAILFAILGIGAYIAWNAAQQVLTTPADFSDAEWTSFEAPPNSVAVLPFVDMGEELQSQYFGDGLAEELLNSLGRLKDLQVTARSSAFEFRGNNRDVNNIARQLRVANIVEGSVRKAGGRLRITAQLINARTGYQLWSSTYDRDLDDVFAIQTEIAEKIAAELYPELSGEDKARFADGTTTNPAAFDAYLRGREKWFSRNTEQMKLADAAFREAIRLDPNYALAYVSLSNTVEQEDFAMGSPAEKVAQRMLPFVRKALEISPNLSDAHFQMAQYYRYTAEVDKAEASFMRAIELNPSNARALLLYGDFLRIEKQSPEESIKLFRRVVELDPVSPLPYVKLGTNSWMLGDFEAGIENYNKALKINPEYPHTHDSMGFMYFEMQQLDKSAWAFRKAVDNNPASARPPILISGVLVDLGDYAGARHWIDKAMELSGGRHRNKVDQYRQLSFRRDGLHASREWWEKSLEQNPRDFEALAYLRDIDLDNGTPELALARYRQSYPELFPLADDEPGEENFDAALHLAFLLQHMDRSDEATILLDKTAQFLTKNPEQGNHWHHARLYVLQGSVENAMIALIKADQNHDISLSFTWGLEADRILDGLHDHPDYIAMIDRRNAELRVQLASWERIKTEEGWEF